MRSKKITFAVLKYVEHVDKFPMHVDQSFELGRQNCYATIADINLSADRSL